MATGLLPAPATAGARAAVTVTLPAITDVTTQLPALVADRSSVQVFVLKASSSVLEAVTRA